MPSILPFTTAKATSSYAVAYLPYDARLPSAFLEIRRLIQDAAGAVTVEHVGSTSIPGVGGRNAIDVAVPVAEPAREAVRNALHGIGFEDSPFPHYLPLLVGRLRWQGTEFPILVYLVSPDADVLRQWLEFRTHLRNHPAVAQAYDDVKRQAILRGDAEGDRYQAAKTPFIETVTNEMR